MYVVCMMGLLVGVSLLARLGEGLHAGAYTGHKIVIESYEMSICKFLVNDFN